MQCKKTKKVPFFQWKGYGYTLFFFTLDKKGRYVVQPFHLGSNHLPVWKVNDLVLDFSAIDIE